MRIGRLDKLITIQFRTIAQNDYGEAVPSFSSSFNTWALVDYKNIGGRENIADGLEKSVQRVNFTIRYSTDVSSITSGDRVQYKGQTFDIETIQEQGRNLSMTLNCKLVE